MEEAGNPAKFMRVVSWSSEQGWELQLEGTNQVLLQHKHRQWMTEAGVVMHVKEQLSLQTLNRFVTCITGADLKERDILMGRCTFTSLPISWNGKSLNKPYDPGKCRKVVRLRGPTPVKATWKGAEVVERDTPCKLYGWLGFGLKPEWGKDLLLLVDGVTYSLPSKRIGNPSVRGVLVANALHTDVSRSGLVESSELKEQLELLTNFIRYP